MKMMKMIKMHGPFYKGNSRNHLLAKAVVLAKGQGPSIRRKRAAKEEAKAPNARKAR